MSPTDINENATKESATKREIVVEIPVADVARQTDSLIQKYQKVGAFPAFAAAMFRRRLSASVFPKRSRPTWSKR